VLAVAVMSMVMPIDLLFSVIALACACGTGETTEDNNAK
jgi:hypothetical protein